ncbi:hypothetical protein BJX70DRAFT_369430 [Aspergillus crustosus]
MAPLGRIDYGRLKSRTGCKTCKIRRVKCGEEKPQCLRCTSTGRRCDYGGPVLEHHAIIPRVLPTASLESRERRAFEYYFFHAAPSLSDALDLDFWRGTVLRICGTEPAVWDAIAALSTFYEHPPPIKRVATYQIEDSDQLSRPRSKTHSDALVWYSRSLKSLQDQIQRGVVNHAVALVSCVLFLCIEMLQGNVKGALILYHQGMQLMESMPESSSSSLERAITSVLLRVGTIAVIITRDTPLPARLPRSQSAQFSYTSLSDARSALYTLVAEWKVFDEACNAIREASPASAPTASESLRYRQESLESSLRTWERHFHTLPEVLVYTTPSASPSPTHTHAGIIAALLMTHTSIQILTRTALSHTETCYDAHNPSFASIISHAPAALSATAAHTGSQPPFIFDMGTGMSLFITILKCREPGLRRQALRYLRQAPPLQGLYFSHSASDFLAALVAVEEGGDGSGGGCEEQELMFDSVLARPGRVPSEQERVFALHLVPWRNGEGEMRTALQYSRRGIVDGEVTVVHDTVVLPARAPHRALTVL